MTAIASFVEGLEGVKWELGYVLVWTKKMGFTALGLGLGILGLVTGIWAKAKLGTGILAKFRLGTGI